MTTDEINERIIKLENRIEKLETSTYTPSEWMEYGNMPKQYFSEWGTLWLQYPGIDVEYKVINGSLMYRAIIEGRRQILVYEQNVGITPQGLAFNFSHRCSDGAHTYWFELPLCVSQIIGIN